MSERPDQFNPSAPEKLVRNRIDLVKFGLPEDSILKTILEGRHREDNENIISEITEKISNISKENHYREIIAQAVFKSLNNHWAANCYTPEEFKKASTLILDVVRSKIKYDEDGEMAINQSFDADNITTSCFVLSSLANKVGNNFVGNVENLHAIIKNGVNEHWQATTIIDSIWTYDNVGIKLSSESLECIKQLVVDIRSRGLDADAELEHIFGRPYAHNTGERNEKGFVIYEPDAKFKKWMETSHDTSLVNNSLEIMSASFKFDRKPLSFIDQFNEMTRDQQVLFTVQSRQFLSKGITPQARFDTSESIAWSTCDFSKSGLAFFPNQADQEKWLEYCVNTWTYSPASIEITKAFVNEAVTTKKVSNISKKEWNIGNIKGISSEELDEIQDNVDDELGAGETITVREIKPNPELQERVHTLLRNALSIAYVKGDYNTIERINNSINGAHELVRELDRTKAASLTSNAGVDLIAGLGTNAEKVLPLTFAKSREIISSKLAEDFDLANYFFENLSAYYTEPWAGVNITKAVEHFFVASHFLAEAGKKSTVWRNEPWVAGVSLIAKSTVGKYYAKLEDKTDSVDYGGRSYNEGFTDSDPYENHPWRFTAEQARLSTTIARAIHGDASALAELGQSGFDVEKYGQLLPQINLQIATAYEQFLITISSNPRIRDDDKKALLHPQESEIKMTALVDNVRFFVARYLVQSISGDINLSPQFTELQKNIDDMLSEGFHLFASTLDLEIPLYDKLYKEFDEFRETGRRPLEVYLGRDGIYAHIGRRAQDVARRRKMGLEGRRKLRETGEIIEIHPQYTVYPSYFRDNLSHETKRQFLTQESISHDTDPFFYDTGYTGTIPEDIMRTMGFDADEIEKRIRLLSAPNANLRVKGLQENAQIEVEIIENNAKTEHSAEGLILDKVTGKIRHIARPTSPREQFNFMMIKQAISRHYWLQEQLYHEPSGNINLDSENYIIRVRQEYSKMLPQDFVHDPMEYLTRKGETSTGIVVFKMNDTTEIIAKKIELNKTGEARKEFSILISAKKAGLHTVEPVGLISEKEARKQNGGYLLTKKMEGVAGKDFNRYLIESGKFTVDQILQISQEAMKMKLETTELFRNAIGIDSAWTVKDTVIEFDEASGKVESVIPVSWQRD